MGISPPGARPPPPSLSASLHASRVVKWVRHGRPVMSTATEADRLIELRRELHRHPEPAWREFYTTARIVDACREIGVDELHLGPDALASEARMAVPDEETLAEWADRAIEAGADESTVAQLAGGHTGLIAELHRGEGPTIALRV